jgi:hypothetical protein
MKYVISPLKTNDDYVWQVIETNTNQIIHTFYFEEDASDYARFYNEGGGFAGFTPSFMVRNVTSSVTNVNDEFTRVFA